jgi:hypothetical protein
MDTIENKEQETEQNNAVPQPAITKPDSEEKVPVNWGIIAGAIVILALVVLGIVFLFRQDATTTGQIRDVFIIFFALESLIIGAALIVLVVQLAVLINLLQNEIKPIINSTNETVHTIKGTAVFLSDNLVQPVIKLNEYLAGLKKVADLFNPKKQ